MFDDLPDGLREAALVLDDRAADAPVVVIARCSARMDRFASLTELLQ